MFSYISLIFSHLHQTCIGGPRQANSPSLQAALLAPRLAPSGSWRLRGPFPRALAPGSPFIPADSPSPKTRAPVGTSLQGACPALGPADHLAATLPAPTLMILGVNGTTSHGTTGSAPPPALAVSASAPSAVATLAC